MSGTNRMILAGTFIIILAGYLQDPISTNFSQNCRLQGSVILRNLVMRSLRILDQIGICPFEQTLRTLPDMHHDTSASQSDTLIITDQLIEGVQVRVYEPKKRVRIADGYPALVFFHGGGWLLGSVNMYHSLMVDISEQLDLVLVFVEYRLAPEHVFPVPLEDCLTVTRHLLTNSKLFGVNEARIAVGGDSAGGNLAAAVSMKLRDEAFKPMPKLQLLIYPVLQGMDFALPSFQQNGNGPALKTFELAEAYALYAFGSRQVASTIAKNAHTSAEVKNVLYIKYIRHDDVPEQYKYKPYEKPALDFGDEALWSQFRDIFMNPYFAPLMADDFSGMPDAYIYTAQYDILRDEGILYGKQLSNAGVNVEHFNGATSLHGVCSSHYYLEGQECVEQLVKYMANKL